ncbi:hypothetical protein WJ0W_000792 [Paenibacillus melissococcoides]|uniref:Uncharacterized protein n=1 Tax=Paenibacillus melissococcoides TaxID=2912268 RepID=A0ABM9FWL1_9BACL|nr:hypothetical protein [Paenibacillus melissococcoides]CAH8243552.1 hypothetical protein WJ0W_000792 [Paenibacillus melissococcoides]CAH8704848.1 hypothetical protein WDD9_000778 [Paenibacillus melissococcoides]CAH8708073.1 hypothetical protein HTL2_001864 [Paenibacillus melissococcoides]
MYSRRSGLSIRPSSGKAIVPITYDNTTYLPVRSDSEIKTLNEMYSSYLKKKKAESPLNSSAETSLSIMGDSASESLIPGMTTDMSRLPSTGMSYKQDSDAVG